MQAQEQLQNEEKIKLNFVFILLWNINANYHTHHFIKVSHEYCLFIKSSNEILAVYSVKSVSNVPSFNVQFPWSQINNLSVKFLPIKIFLSLVLKSSVTQITESVFLWNWEWYNIKNNVLLYTIT
jgi:hypothetical protein